MQGKLHQLNHANQNINTWTQEKLCCHVQSTGMEAGCVLREITRGQAGPAGTQRALQLLQLLRDADVWVGPAKCVLSEQQNAEEVSRLPSRLH